VHYSGQNVYEICHMFWFWGLGLHCFNPLDTIIEK